MLLSAAAVPAEDPLIVQLAPFLLAAISILGSVWVVFLTRRHNREAWLLEKRFAAYSDLTQQGSLLLTQYSERFVKGGGEADGGVTAAEADLVNEGGAVLTRKVNDVVLAGPRSVAIAAQEVARTAVGVAQLLLDHPRYGAARDHFGTASHAVPELRALADALTEFGNAAKKEIRGER